MVDVSFSLTAVCAVDVHAGVVISVLPADDFSAFSSSSRRDTCNGVTCRHFLVFQNKYMIPSAVVISNAVCLLASAPSNEAGLNS